MMLSRAFRTLCNLNSSSQRILSQQSYRHFVTSIDGSEPPSSTSKTEENENDLFSEQVTRDLHPGDIEKLKITYGLVKQHADAVNKGIPEIDPSKNPIIDPRSFEIRRLPKLPAQILEHFRKELPGEIADETKPIFTKEIWDSLSSGKPSELINESGTVANEWEIVDQRTMTKQSLLRRGRAHMGMISQTKQQQQPHNRNILAQKKKKLIHLRNEQGKIEVDLRSVATLNMFISDTGKILPRRKSKLTAKSQKLLSKAIKRARCMALINPAPTGPTMAELAALHTPEELDVGNPFTEDDKKKPRKLKGKF